MVGRKVDIAKANFTMEKNASVLGLEFNDRKAKYMATSFINDRPLNHTLEVEENPSQSSKTLFPFRWSIMRKFGEG